MSLSLDVRWDDPRGPEGTLRIEGVRDDYGYRIGYVDYLDMTRDEIRQRVMPECSNWWKQRNDDGVLLRVGAWGAIWLDDRLQRVRIWWDTPSAYSLGRVSGSEYDRYMRRYELREQRLQKAARREFLTVLKLAIIKQL